MSSSSLKRARTRSIIGGSVKPPKVDEMGKKLSANQRKPDFPKGSLRWLFCMRLRELCSKKETAEIAKLLGVTGQLARKYLGGTRAPDMDDLPKIAKAFGLSDWTDLFRPKNS